MPDVMPDVDYLIIGGGPAGATAATTLRAEGAKGAVVLLSDEAFPPYRRIALSKGVLLNRDAQLKLNLYDPSYYRQNGIDLLLGCRALKVHPESRTVETSSAGTLRYGKLLLATGLKPRLLGAPGETLAGVFRLRNLDDAQAIAKAMDSARSAVLIGGSFIAMEVAAAFATCGISTTLIAREAEPYPRLGSSVFSAFIRDYFTAKGVRLVFGDSIRRFEGRVKVEGVETWGGLSIPGDLAVVGVGADPDLGFLEGSGVVICDGVLTDEHMQSVKYPDIFAAGDIANSFDPVLKRQGRHEHWDSAIKQGRIAARNMLGQRQVHRSVSYFFSDVFDLTFSTVGDVETADRTVLRGSPEEKSFSILHIRNDHLRGALLLNRPLNEEKAAGTLIVNRIDLGAAPFDLSDERFPLEQAANQTVLILQGGGAMGAFECGVVRALEEHGIFPDVVAGVSIGAFNAAIVAANPRKAAPALEAFWRDISVDTPMAPTEELRRALASSYALVFGSPKFFAPRWITSLLRPSELLSAWTSFYDPSPVIELLRRYIDFEVIGQSPVRLLASAVDVETARLQVFDSYIDTLTPEHILASGSLPPGLPWTTIEGRHYWDGGLLSNSPLDLVIAQTSLSNKRVYAVNLYPDENRLPRNMPEVMARRDEILFCEKMAGTLRARDTIETFRHLVDQVMAALPPDAAAQIRRRPEYIQTMGEADSVMVTRIEHRGERNGMSSRDYDFSRQTIEDLIQRGYDAAQEAIGSSSRLRSPA